MSVNGVTSSQTTAPYSYSATENVKTNAAATENTKTEGTSAGAGAVYEPSKETSAASQRRHILLTPI